MGPPSVKRRKLAAASAVPEITFDDSARSEYLTGFSKRKQARIKQAQELGVKKGREELLKARANIRARRKEELQAHVRAVNEAVGLLDPDNISHDSDDEVEWDGIPDVNEIDREDEYIDEAKYTTVTVETVDITKDGFARPGDGDEDEVDVVEPTGREAQKLEVERRQKDKENQVKKKPKKKKFRYEGKIERRLTREKDNSKSRKQAAARKESGKGSEPTRNTKGARISKTRGSKKK